MTEANSNGTSNHEPDIIYHYTTISGLIGIIKEKNIWATNISHLNDWKEFKEFINPFLDKFAENTTAQEFLKGLFDKHSQLIYVCSFSERDDDLSQWRAYSQNANGFSIGFNYSKLKALAPYEFKVMSLSGELKGLRKCQYDSKSREEEILHIMERTTESKPVEDRFAALMTQLTILAPCHKNEKFKDEEEWRLITFHYCPNV